LKKATQKSTDEYTTSQTKLKTKQRLKTLTFQNIVMRSYSMYCELVLCTFVVSHLLERVT